MKNINLSNFFSPGASQAVRQYPQLDIRYDASDEIRWNFMQAHPRPCFTPALLTSLENSIQDVRDAPQAPCQYWVLASAIAGNFNLGGDLNLFRHLIENRDREALQRYAYSCINVVYGMADACGRDVTTIALVQGEALGGGFEAALACNVLIAERGCKMGLPEILFNLFPGMGAYSFLSRRLDPARAKRMILSGTLYSAEELFDMGVVDELAEPGEGENLVREYVKQEKRRRNAYSALRKAERVHDPVTLEELTEIVDIWVDAALNIEDRDLRMIRRLVLRQTEKYIRAA